MHQHSNVTEELPEKLTLKSVVKLPYSVLCISDSRGRGLEKFFNDKNIAKLFPDVTLSFQFGVFPGESLELIATRLTQLTNNTDFDLIIINAGICSFTSKASYNGLNCIDYADRLSKTNLVITTLQDLDQRLGKKLNLCTIAPAGLVKSFKVRNPNVDYPVELDTQQSNLLEDLGLVNQAIIERNIRYNSSTIDLAKQVTTSSLKRKRGGSRVTKFTDQNLVDGVHPNDALKKTWFQLITTFIQRNIEQHLQEHLVANYDEESSSDLNTTLESMNTTLESIDVESAFNLPSTDDSEPDTSNFKRVRKN